MPLFLVAVAAVAANAVSAALDAAVIDDAIAAAVLLDIPSTTAITKWKRKWSRKKMIFL